MEQNTRVFCQINVQEFHLWFVTLDVSTVNRLTYSKAHFSNSFHPRQEKTVLHTLTIFKAFQFGTNGSKINVRIGILIWFLSIELC
jgi:hypothetical protein